MRRVGVVAFFSALLSLIHDLVVSVCAPLSRYAGRALALVGLAEIEVPPTILMAMGLTMAGG